MGDLDARLRGRLVPDGSARHRRRRLIGIELGSGPRGLFLAHQGGPPVEANFRRVDLDVLVAVEEFRRRGADRIVLAGASLGGAAVLAAARRLEPPVQGVISLAAPDSYPPVDAMGAVRAPHVPSLFVSAEEDLADTARVFYAASPAADKELLIVPGGRHGTPVLEEPGTLAAVDSWIEAHLG